jgi:hypothetical protein
MEVGLVSVAIGCGCPNVREGDTIGGSLSAGNLQAEALESAVGLEDFS